MSQSLAGGDSDHLGLTKIPSPGFRLLLEMRPKTL